MTCVCACVCVCVCVCVCLWVCVYVSMFIYIRIYTNSYTLIVVNISFFHRLMSFKVQSCVNLKRTNRKEDWTQQEKKRFTYRKTFEAIVCK